MAETSGSRLSRHPARRGVSPGRWPVGMCQLSCRPGCHPSPHTVPCKSRAPAPPRPWQCPPLAAPCRPGWRWGRLQGDVPHCKPSPGCGCREGNPCPKIRGVHSSDTEKKREGLIHANRAAPSYTIHRKARCELGNAALTLTSVMLFHLFHCSVQPVSQIEFRTPFTRLKTKDLFRPEAQDPKPKILERCPERVPGAAQWERLPKTLLGLNATRQESLGARRDG